MAGVLLIATPGSGPFDATLLQAAGAASQLATALGLPLSAGLIGADLAGAAERFQCGLSALYVVEGAAYARYSRESTIHAAEAIIRASGTSIVVVAHSGAAREWVPSLAAKLQAGLVMNCCALAVDGQRLLASKPVNGGSVVCQFEVLGATRLLTVRTSDFKPLASGARVEPTRLDVTAPAGTRVQVLSEESAAAGTGPRLKEAKIIVSGGRGIGGPQNWPRIEEISALLGAAVGCSRPVADSGWVPSSHQVGISGTAVAPDLYIAVGISGAAQHLAGITAAKTVVAINNSADAEIFKRADVGVVDDYQEVLQGFAQRITELRG